MMTWNEIDALTPPPLIWTSEMIKEASEKLKTLNLSAEDRLAYLMTLSRNAEAVYTAEERMRKIFAEMELKAELKHRRKVVKYGIKSGANLDEIVQIVKVTPEYVKAIKKKLEDKKKKK